MKHDPSDIMNKAPQASENNTMGSVYKEYTGKTQDLVELYKEVYEEEKDGEVEGKSQIYKHLKEINEEDSKNAASFSFGGGSREGSINALYMGKTVFVICFTTADASCPVL